MILEVFSSLVNSVALPQPPAPHFCPRHSPGQAGLLCAAGATTGPHFPGAPRGQGSNFRAREVNTKPAGFIITKYFIFLHQPLPGVVNTALGKGCPGSGLGQP